MYFSDICDEELNLFHRSIKVNEKFKLEEILSSDLFISEIVDGSCVRFIPLFYSDDIVSNDDSDKILDDKCVICDYNESKIFNFKSNSTTKTENVLVYGYWDHIDDLGFYFVLIVYNKFFKTIPNVKIRIGEFNGYIDEDYMSLLYPYEFKGLTENNKSLEELGVNSNTIQELYTDKNGLVIFQYGEELNFDYLVFEVNIDGKTKLATFDF